MNLFEQYKKENGSIINQGVEYAIYNQPEIDNHQHTESGTAYYAIGVSEDQLKSVDGDFDPLFDEHVKITWNCDEWYNTTDRDDESVSCDWDAPMNVEIIG